MLHFIGDMIFMTLIIFQSDIVKLSLFPKDFFSYFLILPIGSNATILVKLTAEIKLNLSSNPTFNDLAISSALSLTTNLILKRYATKPVCLFICSLIIKVHRIPGLLVFLAIFKYWIIRK